MPSSHRAQAGHDHQCEAVSDFIDLSLSSLTNLLKEVAHRQIMVRIMARLEGVEGIRVAEWSVHLE